MHDVRNGTSGLQYDENGAKFIGFGLVPLLLDTHFDVRGRLGRIVPGLVQTKYDVGLGLDEPACLYYDNGIGRVYGRGGAFIVDITKANRNQKQYFTISNVMVNYLTVGDSYNFTESKLIPSPTKHLITTPQHKVHTDSSDILAGY